MQYLIPATAAQFMSKLPNFLLNCELLEPGYTLESEFEQIKLWLFSPAVLWTLQDRCDERKIAKSWPNFLRIIREQAQRDSQSVGQDADFTRSWPQAYADSMRGQTAIVGFVPMLIQFVDNRINEQNLNDALELEAKGDVSCRVMTQRINNFVVSMLDPTFIRFLMRKYANQYDLAVNGDWRLLRKLLGSEAVNDFLMYGQEGWNVPLIKLKISGGAASKATAPAVATQARRHPTSQPKRARTTTSPDELCHNCNKPGHWKRDCPELRKSGGGGGGGGGRGGGSGGPQSGNNAQGSSSASAQSRPSSGQGGTSDGKGGGGGGKSGGKGKGKGGAAGGSKKSSGAGMIDLSRPEHGLAESLYLVADNGSAISRLDFSSAVPSSSPTFIPAALLASSQAEPKGVETGIISFLTTDRKGVAFGAKVIMDTAASRSIISNGLFQVLTARGAALGETIRLGDPVWLKTLSGRQVICHDAVEVEVSLSYKGKTFSTPIEFLVHNADDNVLPLISRDDMLRMGIQLDWASTQETAAAAAAADAVLYSVSVDESGELSLAGAQAVIDRLVDDTLNRDQPPTEDEVARLRQALERIQREDTEQAMHKVRADVAANEALSDEAKARALDLLTKYRSVFSTGYPAKPLDIVAQEDTPTVDAQFPYPPPRAPSSLKALRATWQFILTLLAWGVVSLFSERVEAGACPCFLTGKRLVVDTSRQKQMLSPVPDQRVIIEHQIKKISGTTEERNRFFAAWDGLKMFFQVCHAVATAAKLRMMSFGGRTFVFNRLIMGGVTSMFHLNNSLDKMLGDLPWHGRYADDGRIGAPTIDALLERLEIFLGRCKEHNLTINPTKFVLIADSTYWCGHLINGEGYTPDPRSAEIIEAMAVPVNGADLAKGLGILRWMSLAMPDLARLIDPLQRILNVVQKAAGSMEATKLKRHSLVDHGWDIQHTVRWHQVKDALKNKLNLTHRDTSKVLLLVTDACNTGWAGILLQCVPREMDKSLEERTVEPLGCMGGNFKGASTNWPTIQQEAYAVKRSVERLWHIIDDGTTLHIYSDHKNLEAVFNPLGAYFNTIVTPAKTRLVRWCLFLKQIPYVIHHVDGERNVFADMVSRLQNIPPDHQPDPELSDPDELWLASAGTDSPVALFTIEVPRPSSSSSSSAARDSPEILAALATYEHFFETTLAGDWVQPSIHDVRDVNGADGLLNADFAVLAQAHNAVFDPLDQVWRVDDKVLIPDTDIRVKLVVMAHCQCGGHRGVETTLRHLTDFVFWPRMDEDVRHFVRQCVICATALASAPRRPYGKTLTPQVQNQILTLDFVHYNQVDSGVRMQLVMMDKLSGFAVFKSSPSENAEDVAEAILGWISLFGVPDTIASDQGPGFVNSIIRALTERLQVDHHIFSARVHTPNGRHERANRVFNDILAKLLHENRLPAHRWLDLIPLVQFIYNNTQVRSLGGFAPIQVFLGRQPHSPVTAFFNKATGQVVDLQVPDVTDLVVTLQDVLRQRAVIVHEVQEQAFLQRRQRRERAATVDKTQFRVGDYVMVRTSKASKLEPNFVGPARITAMRSDGNRLSLQFIGDTQPRQKEYHVALVRFFDYPEMVVSQSAKDYANFLANQRHHVKEIRGLREVRGRLLITVEWATGDVTDEPFDIIASDVRDMVLQFLRSIQDKPSQAALVGRAREALAKLDDPDAQRPGSKRKRHRQG